MQAAVKGEARRELTPRGQLGIHRLSPGGFQPGPDRGGLTCSHGDRGGGRWGEARAPAGGRTRTRHTWGLRGQAVGPPPAASASHAGGTESQLEPEPVPHPRQPLTARPHHGPPATVPLGPAQTQGR